MSTLLENLTESMLNSDLYIKCLVVFAISMVPIIELRGALPVGIALGLDPLLAYTLCVIGNMLPVPVILLFVRRVFEWMKKKSERLGSIAEKMEQKAEGKKDQVQKYEWLGLMLFVGIPLPGTGAWTGALIAAMLDMRLKRAFPSILLGVILAGAIMLFASLGVKWLIV